MDLTTKYLVYTDFYRAYGKYSDKDLNLAIKKDLYNVGFKYIYYMRYCKYLSGNKDILSKIKFRLAYKKFRNLQFKYGIEIPFTTEIKEGFLINHFGGITIHGNAKIGKNCTILQGVTIGNNIYKSRNDVAIIGDNVTICSGAKIIGNIKIGDNVTIGANAVVTKDVPNGAIVGGNPSKIISYKEPIVLNTNYKSIDNFS